MPLDTWWRRFPRLTWPCSWPFSACRRSTTSLNCFDCSCDAASKGAQCQATATLAGARRGVVYAKIPALPASRLAKQQSNAEPKAHTEDGRGLQPQPACTLQASPKHNSFRLPQNSSKLHRADLHMLPRRLGLRRMLQSSRKVGCRLCRLPLCACHLWRQGAVAGRKYECIMPLDQFTLGPDMATAGHTRHLDADLLLQARERPSPFPPASPGPAAGSSPHGSVPRPPYTAALGPARQQGWELQIRPRPGAGGPPQTPLIKASPPAHQPHRELLGQCLGALRLLLLLLPRSLAC